MIRLKNVEINNFHILFSPFRFFLPSEVSHVLGVGWGRAGGGVSPHARGGTQLISKGGEKVEIKNENLKIFDHNIFQPNYNSTK